MRSTYTASVNDQGHQFNGSRRASCAEVDPSPVLDTLEATELGGVCTFCSFHQSCNNGFKAAREAISKALFMRVGRYLVDDLKEIHFYQIRCMYK